MYFRYQSVIAVPMSSFPHPHSGPQPPFIKNSFMKNTEYTRSNSGYPEQNYTQPIYSAHAAHNLNIAAPGLTHPPSQIDIPPHREPYPQSYYQGHQQVVATRSNYNAQMNVFAPRNVNTHISNSPNNSGHLQPAEFTQQPPELPPKPHSGQQQPPQQQLPPPHQQQPYQQHPQQQLPPPQQQQQPYQQQPPRPQQQPYQQQLQMNQHQMYQQPPTHQPLYPQQIDPYPFQPPPVPDRPGQRQPVQVREQPVYDKQKSSGNIDQADLTASNQLDELSNNPMVVAARLKKLTEIFSAVPEKYEAAIQGKARKFQEAATRAYQDLTVLKEELQKAKTALNYTETDSHALKGELQVLKQDNQQLRLQVGNEPIDFSNEETQFLIKDLRKQIVNLRLEVPDPNLCDSLRLMVKLMDEDRKKVEKKYTEVTNELHDRDNEISRLMSENQVSGNFIPGGQIALEKQFNATLADLRNQNHLLTQQLEFANQKLEVNLRRDATENQPGPSRVELMGIVANANDLNEKLQAKLKEKEEDIIRVKKHLEASREVMSSSSIHFQSSNNEQNISLQHQKRGLERGSSVAGEKRSELSFQEKDSQIRQQATDNPANKEEIIKVLLGDKQILEEQLQKSKVEVEKLRPLEEKVMIYTNWLNGRDTYIKQLQDINSQQKNDIGHYKENFENLERETKDELQHNEQQFRRKSQQLEALRATGSGVNVTDERHAGVKKMGDEMRLVQEENHKLHQQYENEHVRVQTLEKSLEDVTRHYATLSNQQPHGADYRSPRYNHTPSTSGSGTGLQGRDCGVPYPKK